MSHCLCSWQRSKYANWELVSCRLCLARGKRRRSNSWYPHTDLFFNPSIYRVPKTKSSSQGAAQRKKQLTAPRVNNPTAEMATVALWVKSKFTWAFQLFNAALAELATHQALLQYLGKAKTWPASTMLRAFHTDAPNNVTKFPSCHFSSNTLNLLKKNGRGWEIRTPDPLLPKQFLW